jgi:hypothetical protein
VDTNPPYDDLIPIDLIADQKADAADDLIWAPILPR